MRKDNENNVVDDTVKVHATTTTTHTNTQTICNINKKREKRKVVFYIFVRQSVIRH